MVPSTATEFEAWKRQTDETRRVVEAAIDALNRGDGAAFMGSFVDDLLFEMPGYTPVSGTTRNLKEFGELCMNVARYTSVFITIKPTFWLVAGEWAVTRADGHGVTNHGKDYDNHYLHMWKVQNGKIVHFVEFNDTQLVLDVLCAKDNPRTGA